MKLKKILIIPILIILLSGCTKKELTDSEKFKQEFEKYNDTKIELTIDEENIITYTTTEEINKILDEGSAVIFIGDPQNNQSRTAINILLQATETTDIDKIYYIDTLDGIEDIEDIETKEIPLVINVLEGEITSYHQGTIDNKETLTEDNELELYNIYTTGIHEVLQDACDEEC